MANSGILAQTLAEISVPRDRIIYIHSSIDWLARAGIAIGEALDSLVTWVERGGGTLVFPAFPFRGSHEAYLSGNPLFDVRRTPARVGLLNETLRRRAGVRRSLDPDLSVIAFGPKASEVVGSGFTGRDPTGPDSPFQRIIDLGGVLMGLGVSLNYMNMIHVLDSRYRARYPFGIYSAKVYTAQTRDAEGRLHSVVKNAMLNALQVHIRPSQVISALRPGRDVFRGTRIGETNFYMWDLQPWERLCVAHIEAALDRGDCPCWLEEVRTHLAGRRVSAAEGRTT